MLFMIERDGATVACSSARCVHGLLRQGWRLTDPDQAEQLMLTLARELPAPALVPSLRPARVRSH